MISPTRALILPVGIALMLVGACSPLKDVSSPEPLKARFNKDAGKPRIILLLSPT